MNARKFTNENEHGKSSTKTDTTKGAKRILMCIALALGPLAAAAACNYTYTVVTTAGEEISLTEGDRVVLNQGDSYTLRMEYRENHRNCSITPEDTLYLMDGARWRLERDTQPLILLKTAEWEQPAVRTHRGEFTFVAAREGEWLFEVVRVCDRGGYHGELVFEVHS